MEDCLPGLRFNVCCLGFWTCLGELIPLPFFKSVSQILCIRNTYSKPVLLLNVIFFNIYVYACVGVYMYICMQVPTEAIRGHPISWM